MNIDKHSEKGLATLTDMGTVPENWGLTPIKWEKKIVTIDCWVSCPVCNADGRVWVHPTHGVLSLSKANELGYAIIRESKEQPCEACPRVTFTKVGRTYYSQWQGEGDYMEHDRHHGAASMRGVQYSFMNGLVRGTCQVKRMIGTVLWAKETIFDSRFGNSEKNKNYSADGCQLCAKRIPSGRFVPVNGKDAKGLIHGAWVGEDCARKFFGVKAFKPEQVIVREAK